MKKMLMVFVVGVALFGLSAAASWYLQRDENHGTSEPAAAEKVKATPVSLPTMPVTDATSRAAVRPNPAPENVVQLAASMQKQQESLRQREQQLAVRQKNLDLVYQDLKTERKSLDEVRLQINEEMKALADKMEQLERKAAELDRQHDKIAEKTQDIKGRMLELDKTEQSNFKRFGTIYDTMPAEKAGETLQHLVDSGKIDTAVSILAGMRERQAANVLASIQDRDPDVVVHLLERLKTMKKPAPN
jgi:flagellar motility protein MotE (MotC chaperone)